MKSKDTIHFSDCDLGYIIEGNGPNALVIGSSAYYPQLFSDNLRNHLRLFFIDNRAFAPTPRTETPLTFSLDLLIEDIERMRQDLQLETVIVIGHSGNAFLALEYAKKYPHNVSHVVMIGTSPNFSEESYKTADLHWEAHASTARKEALKKQFALHPDSEMETIPANQRFIWNYLRHTPRIWYDFSSDYSPLWSDVNVNPSIFDYVWGKLFGEIDITNNLADFDKPVLLALGRHDYIVTPPESWNPILSKFKNFKMQVFEKSGHSPFYEEAELFDSCLLKWLETGTVRT